jgi:hypothetical protein
MLKYITIISCGYGFMGEICMLRQAFSQHAKNERLNY